MNVRKDNSLLTHLRRTKLNLLTHSQNIYPYCVGVAYLEKLCSDSKQGFLITSDFFEQAEELISEATGKDIHAIQFTDSDVIINLAQYNANSVFIFDNLKDFIVAPIALKIMLDKIYENFCVAIFIIDQDLEQSLINKLIERKDYIGQMSYLSDTTCYDELKVPTIKDHPINGLAPLQQVAFDKIKSSKLNINGNNWSNDVLHDYDIVLESELEDARSVKRFFNIVYPYKVTNTINEYKRDNMADNALDIVIDIFGKEEIFKFTPKFLELVNTLTLVKDKKHLILTGYPIAGDNLYFTEYGGDLIYKLLTSGENPPFPPEAIMRLYLQDDQDASIDEFNSNENYKILIINGMPPKIPTNIAHFHVMDTYLEEAYNLINILYKNQNYNLSIPDLTINLYYMLNKKEGDCFPYF
jgi:hypothetical protein